MYGSGELIDEEQKLALLRYIRRRRKGPSNLLAIKGIGSQKLSQWEKGSRMRVGTFYKLKELFKVPDWSIRVESDLSRSTDILHRYLRSQNSHARQVYVEDYLNLIRGLLLDVLPNTDTQTDRILDAGGTPFRAVTRYQFANGRWASIKAQPVAGAIYLTLWYHTDKYEQLDFLIAAFAGTCDIQQMLRLLRHIGRMREGQTMKTIKIPKEKFAAAAYHP